ncbi:MAG: hypothetical protein LUP91_09440, partial [Methylococcaceae bacterium]|nr:hypothetical protein [Methylococcaceae bacterium]
ADDPHAIAAARAGTTPAHRDNPAADPLACAGTENFIRGKLIESRRYHSLIFRGYSPFPCWGYSRKAVPGPEPSG